LACLQISIGAAYLFRHASNQANKQALASVIG
jgi:hypothetical protein